MNREERAKQFMAFDALKGLREALTERELRHSRVERRQVSEEEAAEISRTLGALAPGDRVSVIFYHGGHYLELEADLAALSAPFRYLQLGEEKISFDDIYRIRIL